MFKNLTYKQKFYISILGFVLLSMAAYKKTFKHIIVAKDELNLVEEKLLTSNNSYNLINILKNEVTNLDFMIGGQSEHPELVQKKLLDFISESEFDVDIVAIEDVHHSVDNGFKIFSNQLELEGTYESLVQILYDCEKNFMDSRIVSAQLYSKKNYRTNTKNLFLKLIFQNYEKAK